MRGVVFTGGESPERGLAAPFISGYVYAVAADSGLGVCERFRIEPDLVVGDMDSLPDPAALGRYPAERVRIWPRDKDYTDTEIALAALAERGIDDIVLVGGGGGRIDHFLALKALFDRTPCPSVWVSDASVCVSFGEGAASKTVRILGLTPENPVSVFPVGRGKHVAAGAGFHWPIDGLGWDSGEFSLSNRAESGSVSIEAREGRFLCVFPLARGLSFDRLR